MNYVLKERVKWFVGMNVRKIAPARSLIEKIRIVTEIESAHEAGVTTMTESACMTGNLLVIEIVRVTGIRTEICGCHVLKVESGITVTETKSIRTVTIVTAAVITKYHSKNPDRNQLFGFFCVPLLYSYDVY